MIITVVYTLLIVLLAFFYDINNDSQRNAYVKVVCFILFLISGLRGLDVGPDDTSIYYQSYLDNGHLPYSVIYNETFKDPFYSLFARFLYDVIGPNYTLLLCVYAAIFMCAVANLLIKTKCEDPILSFVIFLAMGFFSFSMTGIRQTLAMAFTISSYPALKDRRLVNFLLWVIAGALFHKTALVFLIIYPLSYFKLGWKTLLMYFFIGLFVYFQREVIISRILTSELDARLEIYSQIGGHGLTISGLIQLSLFFILSLIYLRDTVNRDKDAVILYHMLICAIIFQSFAGIIAEFFRLAMFFSIFLILLMPKVVSSIPRLKNRVVIRRTLIMLLLLYFLVMGSGRIPYHFFFN